MPRVRQCIAMLNKAKSLGMSFFSLPPADSACYPYQMDNRQHTPHARSLPKWAFARFYKKKFNGAKLPTDRAEPKNHYRWYESRFLAGFDPSESRSCGVFLDISEEIAKISRFKGGQILWRPGVSSKATRLISRRLDGRCSISSALDFPFLPRSARTARRAC